jgi:ketosteroid isomerase-like protein
MATTSEERERLARAGFEAFNAGDNAALLELLTEDVEVYASPELANPGTFHGHDGYLTWIRPWVDAWKGLDMAVTETETVGERHVIAEVHQVGHGRAGIEVTMDVAFLFEAADGGRIGYIALVPDREQAFALAQEREGGG